MSDSQNNELLNSNEQVVLVLVGLIASGKSTFAEALEQHFPNVRRCNQDDLGSRQKVEALARRCLRQGLSVCIDRTNFDASQRSYWINIAREFPGISVWVIVFDCPQSVCASRLRERTVHPTIKDYEHGLSILSRFASDFKSPSPNEGHDCIIYLRPSDHPSSTYTRADISSIIRRVRSSPAARGMSQSQLRPLTSFTPRGAYSAHSNQSYTHFDRQVSTARGHGFPYSRGSAPRRGLAPRYQSSPRYMGRGHQNGIGQGDTFGLRSDDPSGSLNWRARKDDTRISGESSKRPDSGSVSDRI
ncbi:hypothetical protein SERLADRAFT_451010 [Serpula lacrymans var. lacrymans S7.9]|uniref:P-loop containing nucleoside triphosphate hydrolase protein n=1 Tax=Serpula lacrymans var. lacrymans (strain S7.9) TaxID=578457 RepID=F8P3M0_SERL9|nr:uncharacterized protein SERLADRAFT_451010 [Serpula lacrymans var. lacrymans S7.9]EGO22119.1 hypothetical protein SERLADRAFT_451010 [Serpula lacrymans var. lacrymans S7.9]